MTKAPFNKSLATEAMNGTVKWFDLKKGFGFLVLDNQKDAFLHISLLNDLGYYDVTEGTVLNCDIFYTDKGAQISQINEIIEGTVTKLQKPELQGREVTGTVKWFKDSKGFGFIEPDTGEGDIFIHRKVLRQSGVPKIRTNQEVCVTIIEGQNGLEAEWISTAS